MKATSKNKKQFIVTVEMFDGDLFQEKIKVQATNDAEAYEIAYNRIQPMAMRKCIDFAIVSVK